MVEGDTSAVPADLVDQLMAAIRKQRKRIVVIGDCMIDHWIYGRLAQCQDGCRKLVQSRHFVTQGGAANAARSIECWGLDVDVFGAMGVDRSEKWRFFDGKSIMFRWDVDKTLDRRAYDWVYRLALEMVPCAGAVLLSDYDKGTLTPEFIQQVVRLCKVKSTPCVADCKREPELYEGCIRKCNADWYTNHADVVTRGALPPLVSGESIVGEHSLPAVNCASHIGAGDCFAAHLALALAYGFSLKRAAAIAHSAGRVYVQHAHSRPPLPGEIAADMRLAEVGAAQVP